ncbi:hypothetical protein Y032_0286g1388 [Ancylostoma ceylanicum]|uniref:Endonuclease/exonuclease/phosphatase domain-containing protein n=1 Tax=Ancylostoma ceylanicum TaxID=53326 RepID=A0A016S5X7_9BILA|nr:hypothetical protein Y032_0286g1388 [Ancylostoma ceylanicum]
MEGSLCKRVKARTSPGSDLQEARPPPVVKKRGLPRDERPRLKTLVRVGTLNIGTLTGKTREVADFMKQRRILVLCLQETRWKGCKAKEIGDGIKLFYHGLATKNSGVAIAVAPPLKDHVSSDSGERKDHLHSNRHRERFLDSCVCVCSAGRVWRSGKRLAAHAHGRWFDPAPTANQAIHPSGVGKLVPEESGRMKH